MRAALCSAPARTSLSAARPCRRPFLPSSPVPCRRQQLQKVAALEIDWSDPDTQIAALGAVVGLVLGVGVPAFYISRAERDEERLEEIRALNRATKEATGQYMTREEIAAIRPPHWTDGKEFVDDD